MLKTQKQKLLETPQNTRIVLHVSFALPGPFRTIFELTNYKTGVENTPDAATLTLHAFEFLERPTNIEHILFWFFNMSVFPST